MFFWLLDVKSLVDVGGKDVAFDYINTYYEKCDAIAAAELLAMDDDVLEVSVHKWILNDDGSQDHADPDDKESISFYHINRNHRELKLEV